MQFKNEALDLAYRFWDLEKDFYSKSILETAKLGWRFKHYDYSSFKRPKVEYKDSLLSLIAAIPFSDVFSSLNNVTDKHLVEDDILEFWLDLNDLEFKTFKVCKRGNFVNYPVNSIYPTMFTLPVHTLQALFNDDYLAWETYYKWEDNNISKPDNRFLGHWNSPHSLYQVSDTDIITPDLSLLANSDNSWRLLLQVASENNLVFGDYGSLFFMIHDLDLQQSNFSNVRLVYGET